MRSTAGDEELSDVNITIRPAGPNDLVQIVRLLAEDALGQAREEARDPLLEPYLEAFAAIERDANQVLAVAVQGATVLGTLQLSFLPGLSRRGAWRGQIEAVRVAGSARGSGLGQRLFDWAIEECRNRGCRLVQLTSDRTRTDAHRFYERLGFEASHLGYKLMLEAENL